MWLDIPHFTDIKSTDTLLQFSQAFPFFSFSFIIGPYWWFLAYVKELKHVGFFFSCLKIDFYEFVFFFAYSFHSAFISLLKLPPPHIFYSYHLFMTHNPWSSNLVFSHIAFSCVLGMDWYICTVVWYVPRVLRFSVSTFDLYNISSKMFDRVKMRHSSCLLLLYWLLYSWGGWCLSPSVIGPEAA